MTRHQRQSETSHTRLATTGGTSSVAGQLLVAAGQLQRVSQRQAQLVNNVTLLGAERTPGGLPAPVASSLGARHLRRRGDQVGRLERRYGSLLLCCQSAGGLHDDDCGYCNSIGVRGREHRNFDDSIPTDIHVAR